MFTFPNVFHFFAHEFARLSAGRFAFALVFVRAFNCFFFWHTQKCFAPSRTFGRARLHGTCAHEGDSRNGQIMVLPFPPGLS